MRRSRWREFFGIQTPNEGSTDIDKDSTTEKLRKLRKGFSNNSWKHSYFGLLKPYKTSMRSFFEAIRAAKGFGL
jgi:hypothetical protein